MHELPGDGRGRRPEVPGLPRADQEEPVPIHQEHDITTDTHAAPTAADIRDQRLYVEERRRLLDLAERELARMLAATGRRPGDGSDQPSFLPEEPDPAKLF